MNSNSVSISARTANCFTVASRRHTRVDHPPQIMAANLFVQHCALVLILLMSCTPSASSAEFFGLGFLPSYDVSVARDVSDDGKVVVGISNFLHHPTYFEDAFRWTRETGMQAIADAPLSHGYTVSGDGNVIAGIRWQSTGDGTGYYWTDATGAIDLCDTSCVVYGASRDGSTLVGYDYPRGAYRWTSETGVILLGNVATGEARDVSADGAVIVGHSDRNGFIRAWRWTPQTGSVFLDDRRSFARAVSGDGSTIVGRFRPDGSETLRAYRWTEDAGMLGLESPGVLQSRAEDVSHDGSVIVGDAWFDPTGTGEAFIWTAQQGMRRLKEVLIDDHGLAASLSGWTDLLATSISGDGRTIVGRGRNPLGLTEAFLAHLDPFFPEVLAGDYNRNGIVDQGDLDLVLLNWGDSAIPPPTGWINNPPGGLIDQDELDRVLLNWGSTSAREMPLPAAVPEPRTLALLAMLLIACPFAHRLKSMLDSTS